ncbi:MAG TPA: alpha/beta hydrolase [Povalibacter sp.]
MGQALTGTPIGDRFIELNDARLRVRATGAGPAVVFLHGWALDLDMWQPQFAGLARHVQVVAFDRRGFGLSSGEPDIARDVDDVLAIMDRFDIRKAVVVGMSQGARVGLRFAQRFSKRVCGLILDGPPHLVASAIDELPMTHFRELALAEGLDAFRQQWLRHPFTQLHSTDDRARTLLRKIVERYPGRDLQCPTATAVTPQPDLAALQGPSLVINGEYDSAARLIAGDDLAQHLPNARYAIVKGAGHLPNIDNPSAYNELVLSFIRSHTAQRLAGTA